MQHCIKHKAVHYTEESMQEDENEEEEETISNRDTKNGKSKALRKKKGSRGNFGNEARKDAAKEVHPSE